MDSYDRKKISFGHRKKIGKLYGLTLFVWALVARENLDHLWNPEYAAGSYSSVVQLLISNALEMLASQPTLTNESPSSQANIEYEWWSLVKLDAMITYLT